MAQMDHGDLTEVTPKLSIYLGDMEIGARKSAQRHETTVYSRAERLPRIPHAALLSV